MKNIHPQMAQIMQIIQIFFCEICIIFWSGGFIVGIDVRAWHAGVSI